MQKKNFVLIFLFFAFVNAFAQEDSAKKWTIKPALDFDQRFYYMQHRWANVWGYREGMLMNDRFKVGIGEYYMNENVRGGHIPRTIDASLPITQNQKLYFGTVYFEKFIFRHKYLETSLVFEGGYGRTVNRFTNSQTGELYRYYNRYFIPAGAGFSANLKFPAFFGFKPFRWFGLNFVTGYRTSVSQGDTVHDYAGFYWSISGAVFLDRMLDDWKSRKGRAAN